MSYFSVLLPTHLSFKILGAILQVSPKPSPFSKYFCNTGSQIFSLGHQAFPQGPHLTNWLLSLFAVIRRLYCQGTLQNYSLPSSHMTQGFSHKLLLLIYDESGSRTVKSLAGACSDNRPKKERGEPGELSPIPPLPHIALPGVERQPSVT